MQGPSLPVPGVLPFLSRVITNRLGRAPQGPGIIDLGPCHSWSSCPFNEFMMPKSKDDLLGTTQVQDICLLDSDHLVPSVFRMVDGASGQSRVPPSRPTCWVAPGRHCCRPKPRAASGPSRRGLARSLWMLGVVGHVNPLGSQRNTEVDLLFSFLHMFLFSYCSSETKEVDLMRTNSTLRVKKTHVIASEHGLINHFQYLSLSYLWPLISSQHRLYRNQVHRY